MAKFEVTLTMQIQRAYIKEFEAKDAADAERQANAEVEDAELDEVALEDLDWIEDGDESLGELEITHVQDLSKRIVLTSSWAPRPYVKPPDPRREEAVPNWQCNCKRCQDLKAQRLLPAGIWPEGD